MTIRVAVVGATGKLGAVVTALVESAPDLELVAALGSRSPLDDMLGPADARTDVVVDVTLPGVSENVVEFAVEHGRNVLIGTSGWSAERIAALAKRLEDRPEVGVLVIPNFSLGSALGSAFAAAASRFYDSIEIVEAHGAGKVDSPSGTAVRTAELIATARGERGPVAAPHTDQRARGQQVASVPVHSLRLQGVVARQQVILGGAGETLTISHDTIDSSAYRAGILLALRAAADATGVTVGLDTLIDLGISAPHPTR
ncbi:MAG TPA: 4-hydroxy-tetrahydrodipicolinate reductase [Humibacter sp.]|nr:4-hydroxy-tetrahydrodipicolinate reductase [Humibacter sp.]